MKIKEFYTKHKKAIIFGGTAVVGIGVAIALKKSKAAKAVVETAEKATSSFKPYVMPPTEKLASFGFDGIDVYEGVYESMTDYGLKVKDLGALGEAMQELDRIGPDNEVYVLFNVIKSEGAKATEAIGAMIKTGNAADSVALNAIKDPVTGITATVKDII